MDIIRTCESGKDKTGVQVNLVLREHLLYVIKILTDEVEYTLEYTLPNGQGGTLEDSKSCPSPCRREWPKSVDEIPPDDSVVHTLGIQFLSPGTLEYRVEHHDSNCKVLEVPKDCRYENLDGAGSFFDALTVNLIKK